MAQITQNLTQSKITTVLSFAFSVFGIFTYFLFGHFGAHYETPFSSSLVIIFIYWIVALISQLFFIIKVFFDFDVPTEEELYVLQTSGNYFAVNNMLTFFWTYFFAQENFILSEVILFINLANLLLLYITKKTVDVKHIYDWFSVHFAITGLPLAWTIYAIFWNGAALFHSHNESLAARIVANVLIWVFFLVPYFLLAVYKDAAVSLATSFLLY
ncbi:unnamed protein product [Ambrosiozyma monospora]|uniref:Unnamed protein product n=1 Tax=Ambrosiozyma monospora TaxID=43982 RepID=A0ACB5TF53_AMBMO|nr:unnamed protein product [Ambrosiozyma monospora]